MDEKNIKYKEYYIAYMDILGFKNIVEDEKFSCSEIYSILSKSNKTQLKTISRNNHVVLDSLEIGTYIMSDSIVYYISVDEENALAKLLSNCSVLMYVLSKRSTPVSIRGAVTKGKLMVEDRIIFGPGLTAAYRLENECSLFPRIIIDGRIKLELPYNHSSPSEIQNIKILLDQLLYSDDDDWLCVKNLLFFGVNSDQEVKEYMETINKEFSETHDKRKRDKLLYLIRQCKKYLKI